jgi:hypothetical protein
MSIVRVTRQRGKASLASFVHAMISMCNAAEFMGHRAYVDWTSQPAELYRDSRDGNQWEWFLDEPMVEDAPGDASEWVYESPNWRPDPSLCGVAIDSRWELPWNTQTPEAIATLRRIVPKFLRFKRHIIDRSEALFARYNLNPQRTVAVSHRGTDKGVEAPIVPIERYYPHITEAVSMGMQVWVKAEEGATAEKLARRYPGCVIMREFFAAPSTGKLSDAISDRSGYDKGLDAMTMLYMMSRCRVLLKNAGNLSDLAAGMSIGETVCVQ